MGMAAVNQLECDLKHRLWLPNQRLCTNDKCAHVEVCMAMSSSSPVGSLNRKI